MRGQPDFSGVWTLTGVRVRRLPRQRAMTPDHPIISKRACENTSENIRLVLKGRQRSVSDRTCNLRDRESPAQRSLLVPCGLPWTLTRTYHLPTGGQGAGTATWSAEGCAYLGDTATWHPRKWRQFLVASPAARTHLSFRAARADPRSRVASGDRCLVNRVRDPAVQLAFGRGRLSILTTVPVSVTTNAVSPTISSEVGRSS